MSPGRNRCRKIGWTTPGQPSASRLLFCSNTSRVPGNRIGSSGWMLAPQAAPRKRTTEAMSDTLRECCALYESYDPSPASLGNNYTTHKLKREGQVCRAEILVSAGPAGPVLSTFEKKGVQRPRFFDTSDFYGTIPRDTARGSCRLPPRVRRPASPPLSRARSTGPYRCATWMWLSNQALAKTLSIREGAKKQSQVQAIATETHLCRGFARNPDSRFRVTVLLSISDPACRLTPSLAPERCGMPTGPGIAIALSTVPQSGGTG